MGYGLGASNWCKAWLSKDKLCIQYRRRWLLPYEYE